MERVRPGAGWRYVHGRGMQGPHAELSVTIEFEHALAGPQKKDFSASPRGQRLTLNPRVVSRRWKMTCTRIGSEWHEDERVQESITVGDVTVEYEVIREVTDGMEVGDLRAPAPDIVHVAEAYIPGIGSCRAEIRVGENR